MLAKERLQIGLSVDVSKWKQRLSWLSRLSAWLEKKSSYFTYLLSNSLVLLRSVMWVEQVLTDGEIEVLILGDV